MSEGGQVFAEFALFCFEKVGDQSHLDFAQHIPQYPPGPNLSLINN
jgi:hypothetical protein